MRGTEREEWDHFVAETPGGTVFQSWDWMEARELVGWRAHPLLSRDAKGRIRAGALLGGKRIGPWSVLYAQRGPVWRDANDLTRLLVAMRALAREEGAAFVKLNPDLREADPAEAIFSQAGFLPSPSEAYMHRTTHRIDLDRGEAEILGSMEGRTRRAIHRAHRDGVVIEIGRDQETLARFERLARGTARRRGYPMPSSAFLESLRRSLAPRHRWATAVARLGAIDVAGGIFLFFVGRCTYMWGGSSPDQSLKRCSASEALHWEMIRHAKAVGCHTYDLHGVPRNTVSSRRGGIEMFKRGFGGERIDLIGDRDLPVRRSLYAAWRRLEPLRLSRKRGT